MVIDCFRLEKNLLEPWLAGFPFDLHEFSPNLRKIADEIFDLLNQKINFWPMVFTYTTRQCGR